MLRNTILPCLGHGGGLHNVNSGHHQVSSNAYSADVHMMHDAHSAGTHHQQQAVNGYQIGSVVDPHHISGGHGHDQGYVQHAGK